MAVHLPRLLEAVGANTVQAVAAGAFIGPSQVAARLLEASFMSVFHPMVSARLSVALHPIGAAVPGLFGAAAASAPFTILSFFTQRGTPIVVQYLAARKRRLGEDQVISKPAGTGCQALWLWRLRPVLGICAPFRE
jgi:hypothetical protein